MYIQYIKNKKANKYENIGISPVPSSEEEDGQQNRSKNEINITDISFPKLSNNIRSRREENELIKQRQRREGSSEYN